jgi:hypothetical protein
MSSKPARKKLTVALAFFVCAFLLLACAPRESYTNKPPRSTDHTINELAEKACKLAGKKVRFASQKEEALARVHRIVILNGDSLGELEQIFATMNVAKWDISNDADMLVPEQA